MPPDYVYTGEGPLKGHRPTPIAGWGEKVSKENMVLMVVDHQGTCYIVLHDHEFVLIACGSAEV